LNSTHITQAIGVFLLATVCILSCIVAVQRLAARYWRLRGGDGGAHALVPTSETKARSNKPMNKPRFGRSIDADNEEWDDLLEANGTASAPKALTVATCPSGGVRAGGVGCRFGGDAAIASTQRGQVSVSGWRGEQLERASSDGGSGSDDEAILDTAKERKSWKREHAQLNAAWNRARSGEQRRPRRVGDADGGGVGGSTFGGGERMQPQPMVIRPTTKGFGPTQAGANTRDMAPIVFGRGKR
jgi:hypothetical protein